MAYVCHEHSLLFFAAPGTGSSAVIQSLIDGGIGEYLPKAPIVRDGTRVTPDKHSTLPQLKAGNVFEPVSSYLRVVGVRCLFSWYPAVYLRNRTKRLRQIDNKKSWIWQLPEKDRNRYISNIKRQTAMTFADYLHDLLDKHEPINLHEDFHASMDFYIHQESLTEDFEAVKKKVGLPDSLGVPVFNATGALPAGRTYSDYYTPDLVEYVYAKNRPFFDRFPEYSLAGLDEDKARAQRIAFTHG